SEGRGDSRQLAAPLYEDHLRTVHQNVADRRIAEERLDRSESDHLVDDLLYDLVALALAERSGFIAQKIQNRAPDLCRYYALVLDLLQRVEVEPLDEPAVQIALELIHRAERLFLDAVRVHARCSCRRRRLGRHGRREH